MKEINLISISVIILFVMSGCGDSKQVTEEFITVDITKTNYPKKELILQDFMDVEYIPLETKDSFLNQGFVQDIGKDFIILINRSRDGDIFIYDKTGKAIRKINRKGQGGEEYITIVGITLDEDNEEIYVNNFLARKIQVYDLYGNFKRSLKQKENEGSFYTEIFNFDKKNLMCYGKYDKDGVITLISKQDGSITKEFKIPFEEKKLLQLQTNNNFARPNYHPSIIPYNGNWILSEYSSDTVYTISPDFNLHPFIVRKPPIQSMDPGIYLIIRLISDRYYFMETIKNEFNFGTGKGFPKTYLMYNTQEKDFSGYTMYNGDYSTKKEIYMSSLRPVGHDSQLQQILEAHELVKAYEKGELKGKLKEIAATLNEDSNPVIMLIKHKKEITHE